MRYGLAVGFPYLLLLGQQAAPDEWRRGVARVEIEGKQPGTGFVVELRDDQAKIVTAAHVIAGGKPTVIFEADRSGRKFAVQRIRMEGSGDRDLALLVVSRPPPGVVSLEPCSRCAVQGDALEAGGYPAALDRFSVLKVSLSSTQGRDLNVSPETAEGFSGGPVIARGTVAGMIWGRVQGFGQAVNTASIQAYLSGHEIEWKAREEELPTQDRDAKSTVTTLTEALRQSPSRPDLYIERARAYLSLRQIASASRDIDQALKLDPGNLQATEVRGDVAMVSKQFGAAINEYNFVYSRKPARAICAKLAGAFRRNGATETAAELEERCASLRQ